MQANLAEVVPQTLSEAKEAIQNAIMYLYGAPSHIRTGDAIQILADRYLEVHKQLKHFPRETCTNVMRVNAPDDIDQCGAGVEYFCDACELLACCKSCLSEQGCKHEAKLIDEAVSA